MSDKPLMPLATSVWLIDNTSLAFDQIADFCGLHPLQVKGIADGDVAVGVRGINPISNNQLAREEIEKAEANPEHRMKLSRPKIPTSEVRKGPRYTPVSKRQNRPDAIAWLVRNHPEVTDAQISKLLGTTKSTIQSVRDRSHWNAQNIAPTDPVGLGLCTQIELDMMVRKAAAKLPKKPDPAVADTSPRLMPAAASLAPAPADDDEETEIDADKVFARLKGGALEPAEEEV